MALTDDIRSLRRSFYFIRHAQSVANAGNYVAGQLDVPLSTHGEQQAKRLAAFMATLDPAPRTVVTTHLDRTRRTASILTEDLALPVFEEAGLAEQFFGNLQGVSKDILEKDQDKNWIEAPSGGETYEDFRKRILSALFNALSQADDPALIVGHSGTMRAIMHEFGNPIPGAKNATLYYFEANEADEGLPWNVYEYEPAADGKALQKSRMDAPGLG